jgi:hypothetical protein
MSVRLYNKRKNKVDLQRKRLEDFEMIKDKVGVCLQGRELKESKSIKERMIAC